VLGEAMERVYGGHLCYGPPIENGFYYDMFSPECNVSRIFKQRICELLIRKKLGRLLLLKYFGIIKWPTYVALCSF
jgi:hypothetical protein